MFRAVLSVTVTLMAPRFIYTDPDEIRHSTRHTAHRGHSRIPIRFKAQKGEMALARTPRRSVNKSYISK